MKKLIITFTIASAIFLTNCNNSEKESSLKDMKMTELNLADKGIPVTVKAPEGAKVKEGMFSGEFGGIRMYDYEIVKNSFALEVSMDDAEELRTAKEITEDAAEAAQTEEGFAGFVKKEPDGFIYKIKTDDYEEYKFYHVLIKNNRAIEFNEGLKLFTGFNLNDIKILYDIAKNAE
ncbi:MAG: hypothetical protein GXO50_07975 [Chlorobi bacterium]|nr:hypothetical protein [Chlorobiota bacterium]